MTRHPVSSIAARLVLAVGLLAVLPAGGFRRGPAGLVGGGGTTCWTSRSGSPRPRGRFGFDVGEFSANLTLAIDGPGSLSGAGTTAGETPVI